MKILIVSPIIPYPFDSGAAIRIFNLITNLSDKNEVQLISIADRHINENDIDELRKYCSKVYVLRLRKHLKIFQLPKVIERFLKGQPFMLKYAESKDLARVLSEVTSKEQFDIIQFEHSYMAKNVQYLNQSNKAKKVLSFHNIASAQYYRVFKNEKKIFNRIKYLMEWIPMLGWEPKVASLFDRSIVVSKMDMSLLKFLNPTLEVSVVPNGVNSKIFTPSETNDTEKNILMVGSLDYAANADAVMYFFNTIFPMILERIPESKLIIVGRNPPKNIQMLSKDPHVTVRGNVADVKPFYKQAKISVVPLRSGGGTRLKIAESMAMGVPVISTSIGCEGMAVHNNRDILITDEPAEFAQGAIDLLSSPQLWDRLAREGRKLIEKKYDWQQIAFSLQKIYEELVTA
jgi:sugar transferase (PEP-CTERM/EpsH1 system associated)